MENTGCSQPENQLGRTGGFCNWTRIAVDVHHPSWYQVTDQVLNHGTLFVKWILGWNSFSLVLCYSMVKSHERIKKQQMAAPRSWKQNNLSLYRSIKVLTLCLHHSLVNALCLASFASSHLCCVFLSLPHQGILGLESILQHLFSTSHLLCRQ